MTLIDRLDEVVQRIEPRWQEEFRAFVDSGDASEAFMRYMDGSPVCQAAVEKALDVKVEGLVALRDAIANATLNQHQHTAESASEVGVALVLEGLARTAILPAKERVTVFKKMAARLKQSVGSDVRRDLVASLEDSK